MAEAGQIRAGRAYVELGVKDRIGAGLAKALGRLRAFAAAVSGIGDRMRAIGDAASQAGSALQGFGAKLLAVGAASLAPLALLAKTFANMGDELAKASQRTGVAVEALGALKYAAEQSDVDFGELQAGLRSMQATLANAAAGSKEARRTFALLGTSLSELAGMDPDEQFRVLADRIAGISDPAVRASLAMDVFGKSGVRLLPLLREGAGGIAALQQEFRDLGLEISGDAARASVEFGDDMQRLWLQVKATAFQLGAVVAKGMTPYIARAKEIGRATIDWVKNNQGLVLSIVKMTAIFGASAIAAGASLVTLGTALRVIAPAFTVLGLAAQAAGAILTAFLSPIGLVSAALTAGVAAFFYYSGQGAKALGFLRGVFDDLKAVAVETFGGIADALAAGDILAAARVLWAGLRVAWLTGIDPLRAAWAKFTAGFVQVAGAAFYGALEIAENAINGIIVACTESVAFIERLWSNGMAFIGGLWDAFASGVRDAWSESERFLMKSWNRLRGAFDDTFDVEAANRKVDTTIDQEKQQRTTGELDRATKRDAERQRKLDAAEAARSRRRAEEEAHHQATLKRIADAEIALSEAASRNATEDIAAAAAELEAAKKALDVAREKAADERERQDVQAHSYVPPEQDAPPDDEGLGLGDLGRGKAITQFGGQNAEFTLGGGALSAAQQTAKNTGEIAKSLTSRIRAGEFKSMTSRIRAGEFTSPERARNEAAREREKAAGAGFFSDRVTGMAAQLSAVVPAALAGIGASLGGATGPAAATGGGEDKLAALLRVNNEYLRQVVTNTREGGATYGA